MTWYFGIIAPLVLLLRIRFASIDKQAWNFKVYKLTLWKISALNLPNLMKSLFDRPEYASIQAVNPGP